MIQTQFADSVYLACLTDQTNSHIRFIAIRIIATSGLLQQFQAQLFPPSGFNIN